MNANPDLCPCHTKEAIDRFVHMGITPGSFTRAVLVNDLNAACQNADQENLDALPHVVAYVRWNVPAEACGNVQNVARWLAKDWTQARLAATTCAGA